MEIHRVKQIPPPYPSGILGGYGSGVAYIKKGLPLPIEIVVLLHEVGHHFNEKIGKVLYKLFGSFTLSRCRTKLWILFMERKDELICRKWMVKT